MNGQNSSLQANLNRVFTGPQEPQQAMPAMDSPFPDIGPAQAPMPPQPTLAQSMPAQPTMKFPDLAKRIGVDTKGLSRNPTLGRLQLMERMQKQFGPGYIQRPEVRELLSMFGQGTDYDMTKDRDLLSSTAKAQRTLKALLGEF